MRYFESLYPRLEFGAPIQLDTLLIEPIVSLGSVDDSALDVLIDLEAAYNKELVVIKEVSTGGSVQEVLVCNESEMPLVLLEGQGLEGAKQNRAVQKTVVIPAYCTIAVPVNCVERGRWRYNTSEFRPAKFRAGPSMKMSKVSAMKMNSHSVQSEVWREVSELSSRMSLSSSTEDLGEILERASSRDRRSFDSLERKLDQFDGYGFKVSGGSLEFMELFGRKSWAKEALLKSSREWLLDSRHRADPKHLPLSMLKSEWKKRPSVGVETQLLADTECAGIAAEYEGELLHLFVAPEKSPIRRARSRRADQLDLDVY